MGFNLQGEGLNGVNVQTSIVAGHDWVPNLEEGLGSPVSTVLFVSGVALDDPTPLHPDNHRDAITGRGRFSGNGVTGWGGDQGGAGLVGVAGGVASVENGVFQVSSPDAGVFGTGVVAAGKATAPAPGVIGQGGPGTTGVVGQAGSGTADGVRGFGSGTFSGVAGFGDQAGGGTGVYGQGTGPSSQGVRGIGGGGQDTRPSDSAGVYGQGGAGSAYGVEGQGSGLLAGVGGWGPGFRAESSGSAPVSPAGVYGQGGAGNASGVEGRGNGTFAGVAGFGEGAAPIAVAFIPPASAAGVYGIGGTIANNGNNNGVEGRGNGTFAGVAGFGDAGATSNSGIGVFAVGGAPAANSGSDGGPGVHAIGAGGAAFTPLNLPVGVFGLGGTGNAPGIIGQGGGNLADGVHGFSVSGNGVLGESGNGVGIRATSTSSTAVVAIGSTGLFASTTVRNGTAAQFDGNVVVNGNFTVSGGAKSAAVPFPDGSHRRLYCTESPENWFEDFGFGTVSDGEAEIELDPGFRAIVDGDAYHVFITEYDGNNALYVTQRSSSGFLVRAKERSAASTFSYRVIAKRRDIPAVRFEKVELSGGLLCPGTELGGRVSSDGKSACPRRGVSSFW